MIKLIDSIEMLIKKYTEELDNTEKFDTTRMYMLWNKIDTLKEVLKLSGLVPSMSCKYIYLNKEEQKHEYPRCLQCYTESPYEYQTKDCVKCEHSPYNMTERQ